ncbi:MAG TPA: C40 family peptidase [Gaiellaceae bacterium]|jgi:cell wall-associated NlpC family hydrolase
MRCAVALEPVRAEPGEDSEQVTQALLGEPLVVEERRCGWARIVTTYDYGGWLRESALERGEGWFPEPRDVLPVVAALELLGAPYEWGGLTAAGIDCSGLVHIAYRTGGRRVPRDSWQQEAAGQIVPPGTEQIGDLVFYGAREQADHVAFWLPAGRVLHATGRDGLGVVEEREPSGLVARRRGVLRLEEFRDRHGQHSARMRDTA